MQPAESNVIKLARLTVACTHCSLRDVCNPSGAERSARAELDAIVRRRQPLARGQHVFRAGEPFRAIYCVRSGCIKTYATTDDGEEQVTGFHLPGELIAIDAMGMERLPTAAVALETSSICEIPFDRLNALARRIPGLTEQLFALLTQEIAHYQTLLLLVSRKTAEARLAAFLLSLSMRFGRRGFSPSEFYLSMSRNDIGNFLGMAVETVSRVFTRFDEEGLITVRRKYVRIHDLEALREVAGRPRLEHALQAQF
ncbi:fumarate/nitrate reduction transcriptional regulator Fnr [Inmirania thermothiophila]|uniref:CRP/FNR family transcriptional regulator n=1 Tax=Inmirania thermothiophila TaxID=1750597 RepID=A0A3N1Y6N3_9GAMM|nr:fumarate/nitrate reduction transcriptional regulator Fnr [Inmirania thermothiophila]ROR34463.1 CRP/FNR family transcriptional regulator [Inmirania thermothiophila]